MNENSSNDQAPVEPSIIVLLQKNNEYLEKLLQIKQKEQRHATIFQTINIFITLLPWIMTLILGFFVWQNITHYLEILNGNLNVLKSNYDALHGALEKITPDFSGIVPKLKETWQELPFGK